MKPTTRLLALAALLLPGAAASQTLPTAAQVAAQIRVGWNVGNSMEVPGGETGWGNPVVSQTLINAVKAAGFNAVRIPCAWDSHANQSTNQIDAAWLARVKEVVDYVVSQNMYAILNIHWDGGWLEEHPLYSYQTAVNAKQKAYWTQIANYFKGYDEHLLFAGTNEVHADYNEPTTEHITVQQSYNQTFVDAVRATGGNNASRPLVVQTYNTNMWHGLHYFTAPRDTATGRQIVEVHFYDPYDYTLNPSGPCLAWGAPYTQYSACAWAQEAYVDDLWAQLKAKWVDAGVPVIIGEYGVATRPNLDLASRAYWHRYVNQASTRNGIKTFYWDNGVAPTQTNGFALFNRSTGAVIDRAVLDAIMAGVGPTNNQTLTVTKAGTGSGTVTSNPSGINCGSTCSASYPSTTTVTLTATAAAGSSFVSWGGACSGTLTTCSVLMSAARSVTATFSIPTTSYTLSVTKSTAGTGTVASTPSGINCGSTCTAAYASGTAVTLTAVAAAGSTFAGWSGDCTGTGTCTVTMTANRSVTASFGSCCVTDISINAGGAANGAFLADTSYSGGNTYSVTRTIDTSLLTNAAIPAQAVLQTERYGEFTYTITGRTAGSAQKVTLYFAEVYWSAAGQRTFNVAINGATVLTAFDIFAAAGGAGKAIARTFEATANASGQVVIQFTRGGGPDNPKVCALTVAPGGTVTTYPLTVTKSGNGSGTVSGPSISCGATCSATYASGTALTLTAAATGGSTFGGWSGACTGTSATCTVTMTAARAVTASFTGPVNDIALTVTKAGTGSGTVTASAGGISCGSTCSAIYASGTSVTLTAAAASGSTFAGWSGACSGTAATCTVSMTSSQVVTATFNVVPTDTCRTASGGQSGNFNTTGAVCYTVTGTINGWGCSNTEGRTLTVNGTATPCGRMPLPGSSPYTFSFTAGTYPWASFYWW